MDYPPKDPYLLQTVLQRVSRSFYLTLAVLPEAVRSQVGLAYLFARAADTIADTGDLDEQTRVHSLQQLKAQFTSERVHGAEIQYLQAQIVPAQNNPAERQLLEELSRCFTFYERLSNEDQHLIAQLLPTIIEGMEFDLVQFPHHDGLTATALPSEKELDDYTYAVAGCVGEFWTKMMCVHLPAMARWDVSVMVPIGIRYGKGLQLVNILKDISKDLRIGRCYIPESLLSQAGLQAQDLFHPDNFTRFRPVLRQLIAKALDHLDHGWQYTMAIPRSEVRLRLACMWPILIGLRTLQQLSVSDKLLDPHVSVKVSRGEVYRMMAATTFTGGCGTVGTAYWGYLRKRVM
ncbi:MAG: squalene/phytoene synthase family protein [Nitrospirales bacterium]|nr:squalene/phytoene synthase family protein [Nitrospira sp.]MDR4499864.1 squalene/phytoene synthase family protein [Nitrospirales bacterium]